MKQYYKIQYRKKDEPIDHWYDCPGIEDKYNSKAEALESLIIRIQQKFTADCFEDVKQFRILSVTEEEVYTSWVFDK